MDKLTAHLIFALVMVIIIVAVDMLFFRQRFWHKLIANAVIVLVAIAFYLNFLN